MVTVEMALALTSLLAVFALVLLGLGAVRTHTSLCQGAREAARLAAVGEQVVVDRVGLPRGAAITVTHAGKWVEATGTAPSAGLPLGSLTCTVSTLREPLGAL